MQAFKPIVNMRNDENEKIIYDEQKNDIVVVINI